MGADIQSIDAVKPVRKRSVWIIALCGVITILLIVTLTLIGLVFREFRKEVPSPSNRYSTAKLLVLNEPVTPHELRERPERKQTSESANTAETSSTQDGKLSNALKFKPYISESAKIQPELKAKQAEINVLFDRIYRHIEEYERIKDQLKPEDAKKIVYQVVEENQNAQQKICAIVNNVITEETFQALSAADRELRQWFTAAFLEAFVRCQDWGAAGSFAVSILDDHRAEWLQQQFASPSGQPIHLSDFNRATGNQDYNRVLYYNRLQGGFRGFMNTLSLYSQRKFQEITDHFSDGVKRPAAGKTIVIQRVH